MTISSTSSRVVYLGNNATTSFGFSFYVNAAADLVVIYTDATGTDFTLSPSQYTLSAPDPNAPPAYPSGGTVTYQPNGSPITTGTKLTIQRVVSPTQPATLSNQGAMWPKVIEATFDRVVTIVQGFLDLVNRSLQTSPTDGVALNPLPNATQRANSFLAFDGNGQPIAAFPQATNILSNFLAVTSGFAAASTAAAARAALGATGPSDNNAFSGNNTHAGTETFNGSVTVPTQNANDNSTRAANTGYADRTARGFLNALRNGSFVSWPNGGIGSSFNVAASATGAAAIGASGWAVLALGATVTVQQATGTGPSAWGMKVTGAPSATDVTIGQRIESFDAALLAGKTCTFQIQVFNNTGGSITPTLATRYAGLADNWSAPVADLAATNLQACANGAWTTVSYTFAVSAGAVNGYEVKIDFGNNFSAGGKSVTVAAADLRPTPGLGAGINAAPPTPEIPDIGKEIVRSARYYQTSYDNGTTLGSTTRNGLVSIGINTGAANWAAPMQFPVRLRAAPTVSLWDGAGAANKASYYQSAVWVDGYSTTAVVGVGQSGAIISVISNGGATIMTHYAAYADFW